MIRKISGKNSSLNVGHLNVGDDVVTSKTDIADALADTFAEKSSSSNYSAAFQKFQNTKEKTKINFKSNNNEHYNKDFTMKEFKKALKKCHDTAVGCDDIHYQFLKHLPFRSLDSLLRIFNQIWHTGILPDSWKEAMVIPIPKPGKDSTNPANYRPIALTSCICKTMERMVNDRLVWFLEKNQLIATVQSGFRKQRGTLDHLVRFETFIREAFIKKEHAVSIFFDLESAYDTTWKYGIMNDLHDFGIRGRLAYFISALYIPNPLQCYACFKFGHHERKCKLYGGDELCRRCGITSYTHHDENKCTNEIKCVNCGEDHPSTSRTCKIWKREKEVVTIKYKEGLSFPEARKIVEARYNLSFSTVVKTNKNNSVQLKDAQTQTTNASTQTTEPQTKMSTNVNASQKVQAAKKPEKPVAKSPTKSQNKVLSDRLPKGSDDQIQQHNRFQCLEEDMEEATDHAEQITNKQGRIIKLNKR